MPKKHRLTGAQIRGIRSSRRVHGTLFSLSISPADGSVARCACVVSKKVSPRAVVRNAVKRRCRAVLQKHVGTLRPGAYLFHAKREAAKAAFSDVAADIERVLGKI
ncbi:MAG: ribonuclease P protein component [Candidatus Paceibacterota bacterium]